jgi:hypothetical protein
VEPRHLRHLRRAAEAASDEAHRLECATRTHYDQAAAQRAVKAAKAAERRAWNAYRRAFNAQIAANGAALHHARAPA